LIITVLVSVICNLLSDVYVIYFVLLILYGIQIENKKVKQ